MSKCAAFIAVHQKICRLVRQRCGWAWRLTTLRGGYFVLIHLYVRNGVLCVAQGLRCDTGGQLRTASVQSANGLLHARAPIPFGRQPKFVFFSDCLFSIVVWQSPLRLTIRWFTYVNWCHAKVRFRWRHSAPARTDRLGHTHLWARSSVLDLALSDGDGALPPPPPTSNWNKPIIVRSGRRPLGQCWVRYYNAISTITNM